MRVRTVAIWCLLAVFLLLAGLSPVAAQEEIDLQLVGVDASEFPMIRITLKTSDEISAPVADLSQLTLRENGAPVENITFDTVPTGVDVTFVLDANIGFNEVDGEEGGLTRRAKVQNSIGRFAEEYMNPDGLDRVSVVVPGDDGQGGAWLLRDATDPQDVIDTVAAYNPTRLRPTPLNAMLNLALEQAQGRPQSDRYQAIMLFSDSRRLPEQLSYPLLTAVANDSNTPIYVAILGGDADEQEIDNARRLFEPTRATYVHMPEAVDTDPIYDIWQKQGEWLQLSYQSQQRKNGRNQVHVSLGPAQAGSSFDLALQAPDVALELEGSQIHRVATSPDAALQELQPAEQPLLIRIDWPDDIPRGLSDVALYANGWPALLLGSPPNQPVDTLSLSWDISELEDGEFDLEIVVTDELGYQAKSGIVPARITTERPALPMAAPATVPAETVEGGEEQDGLQTNLTIPLDSLPWLDRLPWLNGDIAAAIAALLLLFVVLLIWRNRGRDQADPSEGIEGIIRPNPAPVAVADVVEEKSPGDLIASLEPITEVGKEPVQFIGDNLTIGRDERTADIVIEHPSLAPLHARIRSQDDEYWLFDEGSAEGTRLNYERLGLAPRALQDGDVIQFGRINYRFRLRPEGMVDEPQEQELPEVDVEQAVILDMDGLMVDTEPLSRQAWDQVLLDLGYEPLADAFYDTLIGHRLWEAAEMVVNHYQLSLPASELAWRKEVAFARIRSAGIPTMPGLNELLDALQQRRIPWAVATSSPRHMAEEVLKQIGALEECQAIAAGDEVANGKPAPDVFLLAAERLEMDPGQCLAIEDSVPGCQSANAAGMATIAVPNSNAIRDNFDCAAHIMTSLLDVAGRLDDLLSELRQQ